MTKMNTANRLWLMMPNHESPPSRAKDRNDISRLILHMGITDPDEIVELAFSVFGEDSMTLTTGREDVRLEAVEALARSKLYAVRAAAPPPADGPAYLEGAQSRMPAGSAGGRGGEFTARTHRAPEIEL